MSVCECVCVCECMCVCECVCVCVCVHYVSITLITVMATLPEIHLRNNNLFHDFKSLRLSDRIT